LPLVVVIPSNGIRVEIPAGQTWQRVATYKVRADVLFEINGCQRAPSSICSRVNWTQGVLQFLLVLWQVIPALCGNRGFKLWLADSSQYG